MAKGWNEQGIEIAALTLYERDTRCPGVRWPEWNEVGDDVREQYRVKVRSVLIAYQNVSREHPNLGRVSE